MPWAIATSTLAPSVTKADPGQTYQTTKQTTQTVDIYGNVTQVQNFDWNLLTTPKKTYTYTYLTGTGSHTYITDYVMNRMLTARVNDGTYMPEPLWSRTPTTAGPQTYGPGDLTSSTTLAGTSTSVYDSNGQ